MVNVSWEELELRRLVQIAKQNPNEQRAYDLLMTMRVPFLYQEIIYPYIVDFVGLDRAFVLEIDGWSHNISDVKDDKRSRWLWGIGLEVHRLANEEINSINLYKIIGEHPIRPLGEIRSLIDRHNVPYLDKLSTIA